MPANTRKTAVQEMREWARCGTKNLPMTYPGGWTRCPLADVGSRPINQPHTIAATLCGLA